ncbi:MAG: AMP-dependent synthetase/ligase [Saccharofermentanales bacterium]
MQIVKGKQYLKIREFSDLREMFGQSLGLYGSSDAFIFRDTPQAAVQKRTYLEYHHDTEALGTSLIAAGMKDKRVAVIGENSYAWCVAHFSVICGVGVSVPLDRLLPEDEIFSLLERGEVSAIVYDAAFQKTMEKAKDLYPGIKLFICMNTFRFSNLPAGFVSADHIAGLQSGESCFVTLDEMIAKGRLLLDAGDRSYLDATIDPEAMMCLLFTSGTTSRSKAVMLSHKNICADIKALAGVEHFDPGTRVLSVLPLHHTFENTCGFVGGFYFGFTICECDGLRYIQKNMEEYKITCLIGVPLLFESFYTKIRETVRKQGKEATLSKGIKISNALRKVGIDLRKKLFKDIVGKFGGEFKIGICGAAPIDPEIIIFFEAIGIRILQGYGLTETSPVAAGCNIKVFVPGSVGHPLTGVEIAVANEKDGEEGEILIRSDIVMIGYYKDEEATREAIDEQGWFHTGDIGRIDPKNDCLYITGRKKSMIVLKNGKKVFPEEIEFLLGQFDFIKESLVWGEAEESGDVDVWVKVVLNKDVLDSQGSDVTDEKSMRSKIEDMIKEVNKMMPSFKSIKYFIFGEDDMEKTTTKKIKRNVELDSVRAILEKNKIKIKEAAGRNIDAMKNLLHLDKGADNHGEDAAQDKKEDGEDQK